MFLVCAENSRARKVTKRDKGKWVFDRGVDSRVFLLFSFSVRAISYWHEPNDHRRLLRQYLCLTAIFALRLTLALKKKRALHSRDKKYRINLLRSLLFGFPSYSHFRHVKILQLVQPIDKKDETQTNRIAGTWSIDYNFRWLRNNEKKFRRFRICFCFSLSIFSQIQFSCTKDENFIEFQRQKFHPNLINSFAKIQTHFLSTLIRKFFIYK